jgi:plasmid stabilization system protein ParE
MNGPTLEFHPEADAEAESAVDQCTETSVAAAEGFLDELDRAMEHIREAPDRWASYLHGTRRYLMKRFPFIVVYRERPETIIEIVAIAHGHRRPGYWRQRIENWATSSMPRPAVVASLGEALGREFESGEAGRRCAAL